MEPLPAAGRASATQPPPVIDGCRPSRDRAPPAATVRRPVTWCAANKAAARPPRRPVSAAMCFINWRWPDLCLSLRHEDGGDEGGGPGSGRRLTAAARDAAARWRCLAGAARGNVISEPRTTTTLPPGRSHVTPSGRHLHTKNAGKKNGEKIGAAKGARR